MRRHDLPTSIALHISVRIALLLFRRLAIALPFRHDSADKDHCVAVHTRLHLFGVKLWRWSVTAASGLNRSDYLGLGLPRTVWKCDREIICDDRIHRLIVALLISVEPRAFQFLNRLRRVFLSRDGAAADDQ